MKYTLDTSSYNERRYGRPWIARVVGKSFEWGEWIGRNGEAGRLVIECEPGALIATGQKDNRKGRGGVDTYYLAMPNGELWHKGLGTEVQARDWEEKGWRAYAEYRLTRDDCTDEIRSDVRAMLGTAEPATAPAVSMSDFGI